MANSNSFGGAVGPVGMQHRTGTLGDSIANVRADIDAGFVALEAKTTSKRKSSVAQTSVISNDATEQTLFTLTFPANSLECGDWVYFWFNCEVTALASGELRMRTWVGTVGGTQLISGFLNRTSTGLTGFDSRHRGRTNCCSVRRCRLHWHRRSRRSLTRASYQLHRPNDSC